jgi:hypothetical protein
MSDEASPRPVLYLDFDYVLNDSAWFDSEERNLARKGKASALERAKLDILPRYTVPLVELIEETRARVIVCSNWRHIFRNEELQEILAERGIPFHGATRRPKMSEYRDIRVLAIREHARSLPPEVRWCVLDDLVAPAEVGGNGVQPEDGATAEDFARVRAILLGEIP